MGGHWRSYSGVLHVHSDKSDGQATLAEILQAARSNSVDFVILTDHKSRGYGAEGAEGWHGDVLVLAGEEVSAPDGHFLAFETRDNIGESKGINDALEEVHRQSGSVVSIHHHLANAMKTSKLAPPLPPSRADFVEIWSFTDDFLSAVKGNRALQHSARPERALAGPTRAVMKSWDAQLRERPLVALGGLNAHQAKHPLLDWKVLFPYKTSFSTIRTVVVSPELPRVGLRARDMIWAALRQGHCYVANETVSKSAGFQFEYTTPSGRTVMMGETAGYEGGGRIRVTSPTESEIIIRHNGQPLCWGTGTNVGFPTVGPGSYRVELRLNRRPWIYSNAIRLVDELGVVQPTVTDFT